LRHDLAELAGTGLVYRRRSAADETYVFKHALVRDTAYDSMTGPTRRQVHARIAAALQQRSPLVAEKQPELVAWHLECADALADAVAWRKRAGERMLARAAYHESLGHLRRALEILPNLADARTRRCEEIELTMSLGKALIATEGYASQRTEATFAHALRLTEELGEDVPFWVLYGMWGVHFIRSERDATAYVLAKLSALANRTQTPLDVCTAVATAGARAFFRGDLEDARRDLSRATALYHADGMDTLFRETGYDGRLYVFAYLGWTLTLLGDVDGAIEVRERMLTHALEAANPYALAIALTFGAHIAHELGDVERARELSDRGIALAHEQRLHFFLAAASCVRGWVSASCGDAGGAKTQVRGALDVLATMGMRTMYGYYLGIYADVCLAAGAVEEGIAACDQGLEMAATLLDRVHEPELYRLRAELLLAAGDVDAAHADCVRALEIARPRGARLFELRAESTLARLRGAAARSDLAS
jgi:tetratricopeptide (TPR) repeat protein